MKDTPQHSMNPPDDKGGAPDTYEDLAEASKGRGGLFGRVNQAFQDALTSSRGTRERSPVEEAGDRVRIEVLDTGVGVAEADLPHLFEKFYRARSAREGQLPGTGLGLAVTHALAEAQGGSVRAERREGGGMRFVLELPRRDPGGLAAAPALGTSVPRP